MPKTAKPTTQSEEKGTIRGAAERNHTGAKWAPKPLIGTSQSSIIQKQANTQAAIRQSRPVIAQRQAQEKITKNSTTPNIIQRYSILKNPNDEKIYAVSDFSEMITGMGSPNHDLFVNSEDKIDQINEVIRYSPLETYVADKAKLFNASYAKVGLRFKTKRRMDEAEQLEGKEKKGFFSSLFSSSSGEVDLQKLYASRVLPDVIDYRDDLSHKAEAKTSIIKMQSPSFEQLNASLKNATGQLELFKKILTAEMANTGVWNEDMEGMATAARQFVVIVEKAIYAPSLTKTQLGGIIQELLGLWFDEINEDSENLVEATSNHILKALMQLKEAMPKKDAVDMMSIQRFHFQNDMLQMLKSSDNVVLYRACDVTAATLLGNKITKDNQQNLKNFVTGTKNGPAFHYATKVLQSGSDWVSLEGFAASDRDREISGTGESTFGISDHTWQFIMQGAIHSNQKHLSHEDKYFELYTRIRYFLKGIYNKEDSYFSTRVRERLDKSKEFQKYIQLGASSPLMNLLAWRAFHEKGIGDSEKEEQLLILASKQAGRLEEHELDPRKEELQQWDELMKKWK